MTKIYAQARKTKCYHIIKSSLNYCPRIYYTSCCNWLFQVLYPVLTEIHQNLQQGLHQCPKYSWNLMWVVLELSDTSLTSYLHHPLFHRPRCSCGGHWNGMKHSEISQGKIYVTDWMWLTITMNITLYPTGWLAHHVQPYHISHLVKTWMKHLHFCKSYDLSTIWKQWAHPSTSCSTSISCVSHDFINENFSS